MEVPGPAVVWKRMAIKILVILGNEFASVEFTGESQTRRMKNGKGCS
jgi:hypothetical protein